MKFAQPTYALGFWLVIALGFFLVWAYKAKKKAMQKFAYQELLPNITKQVRYKNQIIKFIIILMVFLLSILALMRPQWGFKWQEVKRMGLDIFIAVDVSKSMLASDVKPNRLERSKLAVKDLVKKLNGDRIGLIAFSGTAFSQCPLTVDYNGFLLALDDLNVDTIPRGGTSISSAIKEAIKSYEGASKKYKALIIITDGEDHEGNAVLLAEDAKKQGIKIFCIGIGTPEGELIQITDESNKKSFLKDNSGNVVKTKLNEETLQRVAITTDGAYIRSSGAEFGLDLIYDQNLSKMEKKELKTQMSKLYYERFQIPLAIALFFLIIEFFISDKKKL